MIDGASAEWIRRVNAVVFRFDGTVFAVPQKFNRPGLPELLRTFDCILDQGALPLKNSRTTTAGIAAFSPDDGEPVFLKRTNNKGLRFTLRYLFRSARSFRSARAATAFESIGVRTPEIIAVGEKRSGPILRAGYLVTTSDSQMRGIDKILQEIQDPAAVLDVFFEYAAGAMGRIHRAHMVHGDLKLGNFYCEGPWSPAEAVYGIWDLDSVHFYKGVPPRREIEHELGRLIASCLMRLDTNRLVPDSFFAPDALAEKLVSLYRKTPDLPLIPDTGAVAGWARERWNRMENRHRKEFGA